MMDPIRWAFRRSPVQTEHPRSPVVADRLGLELVVRSPYHDGDALSALTLVTYRLPIEVVTAYRDIALAVTLFVEDPGTRRAAAVSFAPAELDLDSPPPFRGIEPPARPIIVSGYVTAEVAFEVAEDHGPLFFRAQLREHVSSISELRGDRTLIHRPGGTHVVVEGDDR
jgi:hypothetical protein